MTDAVFVSALLGWAAGQALVLVVVLLIIWRMGRKR